MFVQENLHYIKKKKIPCPFCGVSTSGIPVRHVVSPLHALHFCCPFPDWFNVQVTLNPPSSVTLINYLACFQGSFVNNVALVLNFLKILFKTFSAL